MLLNDTHKWLIKFLFISTHSFKRFELPFLLGPKAGGVTSLIDPSKKIKNFFRLKRMPDMLESHGTMSAVMLRLS